jgi:hypothetical protein
VWPQQKWKGHQYKNYMDELRKRGSGNNQKVTYQLTMLKQKRFFFCNLTACCQLCYVTINDRMNVDDEMERMWK